MNRSAISFYAEDDSTKSIERLVKLLLVASALLAVVLAFRQLQIATARLHRSIGEQVYVLPEVVVTAKRPRPAIQGAR